MSDLYNLGSWTPSYENKDYWVAHLKTLFKFIDYEDDISILTRTADFRTPIDHIVGGLASAANYWHQDLNGKDVWMVIWASIHPTEIREISTHKEFLLEESTVYMFRNINYEHKIPDTAIGSLRWFAKCDLEDKYAQRWLQN